MAETWRARVKRESRAMDSALRAVFAAPKEDKPLRAELEALAQEPRFAEPCCTKRPRTAPMTNRGPS